MKYLVRVLSIAVLVTLLAAPFVASAQGDPRCSGLSDADCQLVLQAGEMLQGVTSFSIPNFTLHFDLSTPGSDPGTAEKLVVDTSGSGAVSFTSPEDAVVYLYINELTGEDDESVKTIKDAEVILTPTMQYVKYEGEWYGGEEENDFSSFDMSSLDFNGLLDSLDVDLTNVVTTTRGVDSELHGQNMATFSTTVDIGLLLNALLASPAVGDAMGMGGEEAMSPEEMQMVGAMLVPMLAGTSIDTEQWIGLDDNYVHKIGLDLVLGLDMSMFDGGVITGALNLDLEMSDFNVPVEVTIPTEYKPLDELDIGVPSLEGLGASTGLGM